MQSNRISRLAATSWTAVFSLMLLLAPVTAFANHFELSRLASQLDQQSSQLAYQLRYVPHYGTVRSRAQSLSREAGQLFDAISMNHSDSSVRSHFKDVRRQYDKLEQAFLRANREYYDGAVYREVEFISSLFDGLSTEFYYANYTQPRPTLPYYNSARAYTHAQNPSRSYFSDSYSSRSYSSRSYSPPSYSPRAVPRRNPTPPIVSRRQQAIPPVFRGDSKERDRVANDNSNRDRNQANRTDGRQDNGRRTVQPRDNFDQRSPVLDRQQRQNADQRRVENQTHERSARITGNSRENSDRVQNRDNRQQAGPAETPRSVENQTPKQQNRAIDNRGSTARQAEMDLARDGDSPRREYRR